MGDFLPLDFIAGIIFLCLFIWLSVFTACVKCKPEKMVQENVRIDRDNKSIYTTAAVFQSFVTIGSAVVCIIGLISAFTGGSITPGYIFGGFIYGFFLIGLTVVTNADIKNDRRSKKQYRFFPPMFPFEDFEQSLASWRNSMPYIYISVRCFHRVRVKNHYRIRTSLAKYFPLLVPYYFDASYPFYSKSGTACCITTYSSINLYHDSELYLHSLMARLYLQYKDVDDTCEVNLIKKVPGLVDETLVCMSADTMSGKKLPSILKKSTRVAFSFFANPIAYYLLLRRIVTSENYVVVKHCSLNAPVVDPSTASGLKINMTPQTQPMDTNAAIRTGWVPPEFSTEEQVVGFLMNSSREFKPMINNIRPHFSNTEPIIRDEDKNLKKVDSTGINRYDPQRTYQSRMTLPSIDLDAYEKLDGYSYPENKHNNNNNGNHPTRGNDLQCCIASPYGAKLNSLSPYANNKTETLRVNTTPIESFNDNSKNREASSANFIAPPPIL